MKKRTMIALCILTLALAACGGRSESEAPASENSEAAQSQAVVAAEPTEEQTEEAEAEEATETTSDNDATSENASDATESTEQTETTASANSLVSDYLDAYEFEDAGFGTQVSVVVDSQAKTRTITSNALPNHDTGEFPNDGNPNAITAQDKSWTFTTEPTFAGTATFAREPGVAINGVKFEPDTAERATCTSGEVHNIEAIQDVTDLGLDFNNAHVQPTGEYHYHGVSELLVDAYSSNQDLVHVGFAADGHLIYYSKSGAYQSSYRLGESAREGTNCSYTAGGPNGATIAFGPDKDGSLKSDWDYNENNGQLDECNGITVDGRYLYLITTDYPYISRCLMGEFTESGPGAGGPGAGRPGGDGPGGGGPGAGPPDFAAAAAQLGISEQALMDALGPPPPDFEAAAAKLGVPVEALRDALGAPPQ